MGTNHDDVITSLSLLFSNVVCKLALYSSFFVYETASFVCFVAAFSVPFVVVGMDLAVNCGYAA